MTKLRSVLLILLGGCIVLLMVHLIGFEDVISVLYGVDPLIFAAAIASEGISILLWSLRWKILMSPFKSVSLRNAVKGILIGIFFNNITPMARAGGEPFRAYYMKEKENIAFEDSFATVAVDRILDSLPFLAIIGVSLTYFILFMNITLYMIIILCLALLFNVVLLSLVLYFSISLSAAKKLMFFLLRIAGRFSKRVKNYESRIDAAVEQYHTAIRTLSARRRDLAVSLLISFVFWFMVIMRNYLAVRALGYPVNFMVIVVVQMIGTLVGVIPLLPGGLGSADGAMVFLYLSFRFPARYAMSASLLDRFISFWLTTLVGGTCVLVERRFLKGLEGSGN